MDELLHDIIHILGELMADIEKHKKRLEDPAPARKVEGTEEEQEEKDLLMDDDAYPPPYSL